MEIGAIVLCGGKSTRMGQDKASLPFGPECLLQRIVRLLSHVVPPGNISVVAAAGQFLPSLPTPVKVTRDNRPGRGPLEGLAAGLRALPPHVEVVYFTSCDVPLLVPAFVRAMFGALGAYDIVVPRDQAYHHPLAAVYRRSVLDAVLELLEADQLRIRLLFDRVSTRELDVEELRFADPHLETLRNLNSPEDYQATLRSAGFGG